jgi:zinc protease
MKGPLLRVPIRARVLLLVLASWTASGLGVGAAEAPSVARILDRYIEATGGRAALEKLKSRVMKGTVEVTALGASGQFEVRAKAPNRQVSKIEFGGFGVLREGFDGTNAWTAVPGLGVRLKTGGELDRTRRTMVFPRELKLAEAYEKLEVKGAAKVGTAEVWIVEASPKEGQPDRLYFDQKTGFLLREESAVESAVGEMKFQIDFDDYREVDGVKVPFSIRVPQPAEMGFHIKIAEVKHNGDLPDSEFGRPKD